MPPKPRKSPAKKALPPAAGGVNRNLLLVAGGAAVVIVALVAASLLLRGGDDSEGSPTSTVAPATVFDGISQDRAVLGSEDAAVTLIQFEDMQCPVCRTYQQDGFPRIVDEYVRTGKVKLRFVGMAFIGPDSEKALLHVLAAGAQGKLWQFADALYANQGDENSGWVTDAPIEKIASVDIVPVYVGQSPETVPQLLVRDAEGRRLFRLRGTFWHSEDLAKIADALPVPARVGREPMSFPEFFAAYPGSAYWFENRPWLMAAILGVVILICVAAVVGVMTLLGMPIMA